MNNQTNEKPRYICADIKNILIGCAALIAASAYGFKTYRDAEYTYHEDVRKGYFFGRKMELTERQRAKEAWEEAHKEEVEAKRAEEKAKAEEEKAKAEAERDERETALVDKVIERRNAQLKAIAEKASKGGK